MSVEHHLMCLWVCVLFLLLKTARTRAMLRKMRDAMLMTLDVQQKTIDALREKWGV